MAEPKLKINQAAIGRIAKGAAAQRVVTGVANKVAAAARANVARSGDTDADHDAGLVRVDEYTTDRAVAAVVVPAEAQAADGVLSRAASSAGVPVSAQKK